MSRRYLYLVVLVVLLPGCIPLPEPLSDVANADPDERLVGVWANEAPDAFGKPLGFAIDVPEVQGNPKGLMRVRGFHKIGESPNPPGWTFPTVVGKETYLNVFNTDASTPDFARQGEFARWRAGNKRPVLIARYRVDGDRLVVNYGSYKAFVNLIKREGFYRPDGTQIRPMPSGWLAAYLEKEGPGELFPRTEEQVFVRERK